MSEATVIALMYCMTALACTTGLSLALIASALLLSGRRIKVRYTPDDELPDDMWERINVPGQN